MDDDAFSLLWQAVDLLPEYAPANDGTSGALASAAEIRAELADQEWELALDLLIEAGDAHPAPHPAPPAYWDLLGEAARQMLLDRARRWCGWRGAEARHGAVRARLTLRAAAAGGRHTAVPGDGRLRPMWDLGHRTATGEQALDIAALWVESAPELAPGDTADVRLLPLGPERWRHLRPGDTINLHETRAVAGTATVVEVMSATAKPM
ncbi:hypothetical protein [Streptomyces boluensis]|nr:hypothetical protein [Streptomyces boluensis]